MENEEYEDDFPLGTAASTQGEDGNAALENNLWEEAEDEIALTKKKILEAASAAAKNSRRSKFLEDEEEHEEDEYDLKRSAWKKGSSSQMGQSTAENFVDLTQMLQNEISAPELLPYRLFESLKKQSKEQLLKKSTAREPEGAALEKVILEMDSNRIDFELVALNRIRLQKIAKYARHFLMTQSPRMSNEEVKFAESLIQLRKEYMGETFLNKLPESFGDMEFQDDVETYPKPNMRTFVMFRALKDLGQIYPGEVVIKNQVYACPYSLISQHLLEGDVQLI